MDNKTKDNESNKIDQPQMLMISSDQLLRFNSTEDDIDLKEIFSTLWQGKWLIISIAAVFAIASIIYALSLPNIYKSSATLAPTTSEQSGAASLASRFGGLASVAGINLSGEGADKTKVALEVINSYEFLASFIEKHDLKTQILAVKKWNISENKLEFDEKVYNEKTKQWTWESASQWKKETTPSDQEAVEEFKKRFEVVYDEKKSGLVTLSISHFSPFIAQQWVSWLIEDVNNYMRKQDIDEAKKTIDYLNKKLEETSIAEMQRIFFELIEQQTKTKMLAEVRDQYVLKVIDSPIAPEKKDGPKRALICGLATFFGSVLSLLWLFLRKLFYKLD